GATSAPIAIGTGIYPSSDYGFVGTIDEVIIGKGEPTLADVKRMMLGLKPLNIIQSPTVFDTFRNNVIADGGTFMPTVFRDEWNRQPLVLKNESVCLLIPGAFKNGVIYGMNVFNGNIEPFTFTRASSGTY